MIQTYFFITCLTNYGCIKYTFDVLFITMELGYKIKKIRELKNFTQDYMAQELNVSQATYSRYEKDEIDLTMSQLGRISDILGVKIEDLLSFDEKHIFNNFGNSYDTSSFSINYSTINEQDRTIYLKTIKLLEDKIDYLENLMKVRN